MMSLMHTTRDFITGERRADQAAELQEKISSSPCFILDGSTTTMTPISLAYQATKLQKCLVKPYSCTLLRYVTPFGLCRYVVHIQTKREGGHMLSYRHSLARSY